MMAETSAALIALGDKIISSLRMNSAFFRQQLELVKTGENSEKDIRKFAELKQNIFSSIRFFSDSYVVDGSANHHFILSFIAQLIEPSVCENDVAVECICLLFSSTFPKLFCEENAHKTIRGILTQLQSIVHHSEIYSMPIKKLVRNLISRAIHQFGFNMLKLYSEPDAGVSFTREDLNELRKQHQEAFIN